MRFDVHPATGGPSRQTSLWAAIDDRRVHARSWQAGVDRPAIVLVHGFVVPGEYMVPTAQRLAGDFDVYAPDLPGFGRSDKPARALRVSALARSLGAWMKALTITRADVVANSFGCQVAAELALQNPSGVRRLVLASPTMDPAARTLIGQLRRWQREARTQSWALRRILLRAYATAGVRPAVRTFRYALADRIEDKLPHIEAPTLVVRGANDPLVPPAWVERVAAELPRGTLTTVPGAPHALNFEAPDRFVDVIRPFLMGASDLYEQKVGT